MILHASSFYRKFHFAVSLVLCFMNVNLRCDLTVMTNGDPYLTLSEKWKNIRVKKFCR